jgi:small subunit ribosomal protein S6
MYILDTNRYLRDADAASSMLEDMITKAGGEILVSRLWEERRLAYPINGHRKGTYWLIYFRIDASQLTPIKRTCEIDDSILRTLFLKVDPRIVDALVAHAQSATPTAVVTEAPAVARPALAEVDVVVDAIDGPLDDDDADDKG